MRKLVEVVSGLKLRQLFLQAGLEFTDVTVIDHVYKFTRTFVIQEYDSARQGQLVFLGPQVVACALLNFVGPAAGWSGHPDQKPAVFKIAREELVQGGLD